MPRLASSDAILSDYAQALIRCKAHKLSRSHGFRKTEKDELQQELWVAVLSRAGKFDPTRASWNTFLNEVVTKSARMIFRERHSQKNIQRFQQQSLDEAFSSEKHKTEPLAFSISDRDLDRRLGIDTSVKTAFEEDEEACAHALAKMPEDVRAVCRRLMGGTVASTARELGTSRRQIRNALAKAQPFFEQSGFFEKSGQIGFPLHT